MKLWIIDPSLASAEREGAAQIAACWPGEHRLTLPVLQPGDGPRRGDGYDADAIVVMGSGASVDDAYPWLAELTDWLAPIVSGEVERPLFGICFGHQLIAHLAGAPVALNEPQGSKRLAVEQTRVAGSRLFPDGEHRVVVSHREQVVGLPAGYRTIAERPGVPFDGIEHERRPIASFQFHPEARGEFAARTGLPPEQIDERLRADSDALLRAFLRNAVPA